MQVVSVKNSSDKESTIRINLLLYAESLKGEAARPRIVFNNGSDLSRATPEIHVTTPVSVEKEK